MDRRVPKKLLLENGAPTAADRRLIGEGLEELMWVAALRPATVGVAPFADDVREYLEIAVVVAGLRTGAKAARVVELIHRAIPYPVVLVAAGEAGAALSVAHKRRSGAEVDRVVVEAVETTAPLRLGSPDGVEAAFLANLSLAGLPRGDLFALYEGWCGCVTALAAARVTGRYVAPGAPEHTAARRAALEEHGRLCREVERLRGLATREKQLGRLVELNAEIRRLQGRVEQLRAEL